MMRFGMHSQEYGSNPAATSKRWTETLRNEEKSIANSIASPANRVPLPEPYCGPSYRESNGLQRSLPTNIPDHPTAIQVNGLRQERAADILGKGHEFGVNTYDSRTLCGNWAEERCDKAHRPSAWKAPSGSDWQWQTTYNEQTSHASGLVVPKKGSNADTMFTQANSKVRRAHQEFEHDVSCI